VHFVNGSSEWETPRWLFEQLEIELTRKFSLDVAANATNAKTDRWMGRGGRMEPHPLRRHCVGDGLEDMWLGDVWCNPPYDDILSWARKAFDEVHGTKHLQSFAMLVPGRTETEWFRILAACSSEILLLHPRIAFIDPVTKLAGGCDRYGSVVFSWRCGDRTGDPIYRHVRATDPAPKRRRQSDDESKDSEL
jgi:phage N-6-adenine-methyltransferase